MLTGFKGCGKTTVGSLVAGRLRRPFVDLDSVIEMLYHTRNEQHADFRTIFARMGGADFRELEREAALAVRARATQSRSPMVISLGGGALMDSRTRALVRDLGFLVYLCLPLAELIGRARTHGFPAFADARDPERDLARVFRERETVYIRHADLTLDIAGLAPEQAASMLIAGLEGVDQSNGGRP